MRVRIISRLVNDALVGYILNVVSKHIKHHSRAEKADDAQIDRIDNSFRASLSQQPYPFFTKASRRTKRHMTTTRRGFSGSHASRVTHSGCFAMFFEEQIKGRDASIEEGVVCFLATSSAKGSDFQTRFAKAKKALPTVSARKLSRQMAV